MDSEPWYGAKVVFRHLREGSSATRAFEERVVLTRADSEEAALKRAESHAAQYADDFGVEYTGFIQLFRIVGNAIGDGVEIFSLIRESSLSTDEYLDAFYDTGAELERKIQ